MSEQLTISEEPKNLSDCGFIVYRELDGSWTATTDFVNLQIMRREATGFDIKTGCRELFEAFAQNDLAAAISDRMAQKSMTESQTTAAAVRNALLGRNQEA